jgi:4-amino-4-deoxy-L-arabinose transferase-like glycosyltransferase
MRRFGDRWRGISALDQFLIVLSVVYVAKQVLFVFAFAPFTGHDEVAHYGYVRTVATEGRLPVLPDLESWQATVAAGEQPTFDGLPAELYPYCRYALRWNCQPDEARWLNNPPRMESFNGVLYPTGYQYVANHPPLYYVLMSPVYRLSEAATPKTQHYWLRLAAIPFGLLTVGLSARLARVLFPGDAFLGLTVPTFVAFQPQLSYEAAMVNNDIVAIALATWVLLLVVRGIRDRFPAALCVWLGVALGLAVLAKSTSLTLAPVIALAIIGVVGWRKVRAWVLSGALVVVPAAVVAAPWYLFLFRTYGNFDALDQLEQLQYWNYGGRGLPGWSDLLLNANFVSMRFRETWGEFGWRLLPLGEELLWAIALPVLAGMGGLLAYARFRGRTIVGEDDPVMRPERWQRLALAVLAATCLIAYLAVVGFGLRFELTQARYYFPAMTAAAVLLLLGLRTLIPAPHRRYAQGVFFAGMVTLNVVIFTQYVLPFFVQG